jgi:hypothetical protein
MTVRRIAIEGSYWDLSLIYSATSYIILIRRIKRV